MSLVFFWLIMAGVVGLIANAKGRSAGSWFLYGLLIWPIALVHILITAKDQQVTDARGLERDRLEEVPQCAELIRAEAKKCRFCGANVSGISESPVTISSLISALRSPNHTVREQAVCALGDRGAAAEEALDELEQLLTDPVPVVRTGAKWALETIRRQAKVK